MGKLLYNKIIIILLLKWALPGGITQMVSAFFAIAVFKREVKFNKRYVKGLQI